MVVALERMDGGGVLDRGLGFFLGVMGPLALRGLLTDNRFWGGIVAILRRILSLLWMNDLTCG